MANQTESFTARELELMSKLKTLEDDRVKFLDIVRGKIQKLEQELEVRYLHSDSLFEFNFFFMFF